MDLYFIVIRIILAIISGYVAFLVYKNPKLVDNAKNFVVNIIKDLFPKTEMPKKVRIIKNGKMILFY